MLIRRTAIRPCDPEDPAALACLAAYGAHLAQAVPEAGPDPVPLPLADAALYRPPRGLALVAGEAEPLGCVFLRGLEGPLAEVKRLFVMPQARGLGLARLLMDRVEEEARGLGYTALRLDTNRALTPAIALYEATGWQPIPAYTGFPATHWYEKPL